MVDSVILDDSGKVDTIKRFFPQGQTVDYHIEFFRTKSVEFNLNLHPIYQRDLEWNTWQYEKFVGYFIQGGPVHRIIIHRGKYQNYHEVIDGQHRLTALFMWVDGLIGAILDDGSKIHFNELTSKGKRVLPMISALIINLTLEERISLYLALNEGGTVHSKLHLMSVRNRLNVIKKRKDANNDT